MPDPQAADDRPKHPELFISYASSDLDRAAALHALLAAEGFRVWFDKVRLTPGCYWHKEIEAGCKAARENAEEIRKLRLQKARASSVRSAPRSAARRAPFKKRRTSFSECSTSWIRGARRGGCCPSTPNSPQLGARQ